MIARICVFFKAYTGERAWKVLGNRILKPYYLIREIIIGKLGLGNKKQMLVNIPSQIEPFKAGTNCLHV